MQRIMKTITISFPVELYTSHEWVLATLNKLGKDLEQDGYEDGRHPFYREMLTLALSKMLRSSLEDLVLEHMRKVFGNEMVIEETENSRSETSRAYLETTQWMEKQNPSVSVLHEDWVVTTEDR